MFQKNKIEATTKQRAATRPRPSERKMLQLQGKVATPSVFHLKHSSLIRGQQQLKISANDNQGRTKIVEMWMHKRKKEKHH